jgi:hypothetical protein
MTGREAVLKLRDEIAVLAEAYIKLREWPKARDAIRLAHALERFEDTHNITEAVWPAEIMQGEHEYDRWLKTTQDEETPPCKPPTL